MPTTGAFNTWPFNVLPFNGARSRGAVTLLSPLSIDDRTISANWDDDRTIRLENYAMTKIGVEVKNIVIGDAKRIKRTYTGLPAGSTIAKAYLTVKARTTDADADALFQKSITASAAASGQITTAATTSGQVVFYFDLSEANTLAASVKTYQHDIQVELSTGETHTMEIGTFQFIRGVTTAQS